MKKQLCIVLVLFIFIFPVVLFPGSIHFGLPSAVKDKVEEIKEKRENAQLPSVAINSLLTTSAVSGTVIITAETTNTVKVEFYVDGVLKDRDTVEPFEFSLDATHYADGVYTIEAVAYNAENQTASTQYTVTMDKANGDKSPTIILTAPANGSTVSGIVTVTADAIDDKAISKVEFFIDGSLLATSSNSPYNFNWNTATQINGPHTLEAKVYDTSNQTATDQHSVIVNNVSGDDLPTVSITSPEDGSTVSGTVTVAADASDDKGVSKVEFYMDGTLRKIDSISPFNYSWDTTQYSNGEHTLKATAYDTNNQTVSDQHSITSVNGTDNVPAITLTAPADNSTVSGIVNIMADASDDKGVTKVEFYLDGTLVSTDNSSPYTYSWDTSQYANGAHKVKAMVYDTTNQTASTQHSVTISNTVSIWTLQKFDLSNYPIDSSLVLDSNNKPHIAYYGYSDWKNGGLKYAEMTGGDWSIETVDITSVGPSSIALDSNNNPHIAYIDFTNKNLKYASWTGTAWNIETIDFVDRSTATRPVIALDSKNNPHILYQAMVGAFPSGSTLRYAKWTGTAWNIEIIDVDSSSIGSLSLALDSNDNPHFVCTGYKTDPNDAFLKYAKWTGTAWSIETIDPTSNFSGARPSLALDSNNIPHIAYRDDRPSPNNDLKYAKWTGTSWSTETVNYGGGSPSLALDSSDNPRIAFAYNVMYDFYFYNSYIKYAEWTGTMWNIETVDSRDGYGTSSSPSLALDSSNKPHITYNLYSEFKYATK